MNHACTRIFSNHVKRCTLYVYIHRLSKAEVKEMLNDMPKLQNNDETFFRGLGNRGVISFRYEHQSLLISILLHRNIVNYKKRIKNSFVI